jgi:RNA polymerase sigma-70 factor (ECF subfamily)
MQRHNRRLYLTARGVLKDESEAEDALQETYLRAFSNLAEFRGTSSLSTWLTRIALNEALGRLRSRKPMTTLDELTEEQASGGTAQVISFPAAQHLNNSPEHRAARSEIRGILETAIDDLPEGFRLVFLLRAVEQMSAEETAASLGIRIETVKTRFHRAKHLLRAALQEQLQSSITEAFPFAGTRCGRVTEAVLQHLARGPVSPEE